jgi:uncharacterized membrane protein
MITSWILLHRGIGVFAEHLPLLLGAWLVVLAVQQLIDLAVPDRWIEIELLLDIVLLAPLYAGQLLLALKAVRNEPASFRDLFRGFRRWVTLSVVSLFASLAAALGFFLLIVPGIVWALMFAFGPIVVLDRPDAAGQVGPLTALRRSRELTEGSRLTLFGISLLLGLPAILFSSLLLASAYVPQLRIPYWAVELFLLLSGSLFLGPVQATSYMVVYDEAAQRAPGSSAERS